MNNIALFAIGTVVTLLVVGAMLLLVWGAILDGRYENERQATEKDAALLRATQKKALRPVDAA